MRFKKGLEMGDCEDNIPCFLNFSQNSFKSCLKYARVSTRGKASYVEGYEALVKERRRNAILGHFICEVFEECSFPDT